MILTQPIRTFTPIFGLMIFGAAATLPKVAIAQAKEASRSSVLDLQDAFIKLADEVEPAVVTVTSHRTTRPKRPTEGALEDDPFVPRSGSRMQGTGSGVILSKDGWILTNDHVVGDADRVSVKLNDGREFDGFVRRDSRSDLALIKIDAPNLTVAKLGDSDAVKVGQWAIVIGSPYKYEGSFSVGVVSSKARRQEIRDRNALGGRRLYTEMIQTDAAINPGNSGGPLVNIRGEVVGINTAIESETGGSVGIGFAIPVNRVKFVTKQLIEKGYVSYGYLGIEPETVTPRLASSYAVPNGAIVVSEPPSDSPAGKAGIHVDDVVTRIDGRDVRNEQELRGIVSQIAPGTKILVDYVRAGRKVTVDATLAEAPMGRPRPAKPAGDMSARLGIETNELTKELAERMSVSPNSGVIVKSIDGSAAISETDLQTGDVILSVNGNATPTPDAFAKAIGTLKSGDVVRIIYVSRRLSFSQKRVAICTLD